MLNFDSILDHEGLSGPLLAKRKAKAAAKKAAPKPAAKKPAPAKPAKKPRGIIGRIKAKKAASIASVRTGSPKPKGMVGRITTRRAKKAAKLFTPKKPKAVKPARPPITARPTPPKAAPVGRLGPALLRKPAPAPKPRPAPILARPAPLPAPTPSSSSGGGGGGGGSGGGGGKGLFSGEDDDLDEDSDYTDSDDETEESEDESEDESTDFDSDNEESEDEESEDESEDEDSDMELGALEQATNLAMRAITPLANSPRTHRHHNHSHNKAQRALSAVAPIANAFGTPAEMVIRSVDARLIQYGYPPGTAANLFAALSDLNDSLEQSSKDIISKLPPAEAATLRQLSNIAQKLPRCHPTRTRAHLNIVRHRG